MPHLVDLWLVDDALGSLGIPESAQSFVVVDTGWGDGYTNKITILTVSNQARVSM